MAVRRKKVCFECACALLKDEIALSKKILGRNIEQFFCIKCLAEYLECSSDDLKIKIQEFKEQGCTLFF